MPPPTKQKVLVPDLKALAMIRERSALVAQGLPLPAPKRRGRPPKPKSPVAPEPKPLYAKPASNDPAPGEISHVLSDAELQTLVDARIARGKPVKYNEDGKPSRAQFNHEVRTIRRKQLKLMRMDAEAAIERKRTEYEDREITDEEMREFGRRGKAGEISMEELKMVTLYKFERDPCYMFQRLFRDMTVDRATNLYTPSPPFHRELVNLYLANRRVAVCAPRGHAKSTVTGFFYVLHQALFKKKKNIVLVSATEDLAIRFLRDIKAELDANVQLQWLFGMQRSEKWSEKEIQLQNGCRIYAKGRGGQMRGLKERGTRPDLIVLDDLEDSEVVRSEIRRLDLEDWFNGDVLPTVDPGVGQVVVIGTILHEDSLLSRLMDPKLYPDFATARYRAIIETQDGRAALWPGRFSLESLDAIRDSYSARGQLSTYFMEYMNDPVPSDGATFTQEMIQYFDALPDDPFGARFSREMFVDLGGGGLKRTADPTAMVVVATDRETGDMFVEDCVNKRFGTDADAIIAALFGLASANSVTKVHVEKTQALNLLASSLDREMRRRRAPFMVEFVQANRGSADRRGNMSDGKFQRIAQMEAAFRAGRIRLRRWMQEIVGQLITFPRGQHDDLIDALSYAYMFAKRKKRATSGKRFLPASRRSYLNRNYET